MRNKFKYLAFSVAVAGLIGGIGWYQSAVADSQSSPGSTSDPIVTKSYVDQQVATLVKQELAKQSGDDVNSSSSELEVVTVPFGKKIIVDAGGELIVRSGKAVAYSTDANGLSDMTDGLDIAPGKAVGNNHLILFPRGGRGVEADPSKKGDLIVLVHGGYKVE